MIVRVREWYEGRTAREKRMLVAMIALAVPLLAWLLVVRPLNNAYDEALERHLEAVDRHGRVAALADRIKVQPARPAAPRNVELQFVVSEAAGLAGLTLAEVSPSGTDTVAVTATNARAPAASEWLRSLEARGLLVEELRMTPTAEGGVNVSARLARR